MIHSSVAIGVKKEKKGKGDFIDIFESLFISVVFVASVWLS